MRNSSTSWVRIIGVSLVVLVSGAADAGERQLGGKPALTIRTRSMFGADDAPQMRQKILSFLDAITTADLSQVTPGAMDGLLAVLQSPSPSYQAGESIMLWLRLRPQHNTVQTINLWSPVEIEATHAASGAVQSGQQVDDAAAVSPDAAEPVTLGRPDGPPEAMLLFAPEDFGVAFQEPGQYEILVRYSNATRCTPVCWTGTVQSNPITIAISPRVVAHALPTSDN